MSRRPISSMRSSQVRSESKAALGVGMVKCLIERAESRGLRSGKRRGKGIISTSHNVVFRLRLGQPESAASE